MPFLQFSIFNFCLIFTFYYKLSDISILEQDFKDFPPIVAEVEKIGRMP